MRPEAQYAPSFLSKKTVIEFIPRNVLLDLTYPIGHPLSLMAGCLEDLEDINEYSSRYHHGQEQNTYYEPIDTTELQSYVKRTLQLASAY